MSSLAPVVTFSVDLPEQVSEETLRSDLEHWRSFSLDEEAVHGGITIRQRYEPCTSGEPQLAEVTVEDELWNIVRALCFQAVGELMAGRQVTYHYAVADAYLVLIPTYEGVRILGDDIRPMSVFDRKELAQALFRCGERYLESVDRLKARSATYRQVAELLRPLRDAAREALKVA